jgi:predicted nucleic acid-binding protein
VTCLVFDNSPLSHFARAHELAALESITVDYERVVTQAVLDEIAKGAAVHPELAAVSVLGWLRVVRVDGLPELQAFSEYANRLGSGERDIGEASTLAWAEVHDAIAIVDEKAGTRHARERGVDVHGTLWLVANAYKAGTLAESGCEALVDALRDTEAWFPCDGSTFLEWARRQGLL